MMNRECGLIRVAIDGPGGAGKSTISKLVAKKMGIAYVDTGAMYRAIGLKLLEKNVSCDDQDKVEEILSNTSVDFDGTKIILDGRDVSSDIRTQEVSKAASQCSKMNAVREKLVTIQKQIANSKSLVMDGRDIGTNVIKDAEVKIYLTADPMVRAKRRFDELSLAGKDVSLDVIFKEIQDRDFQDMNRELNPLKQAEDAIMVDTSEMNIEEVVERIVNIIEQR